jgi:hypothetical protein
MVDFVILLALLLGAWRSVKLRHRLGIPMAATMLYLLVADAVAALRFQGEMPALHAFVLAFLGPGAAQTHGPPWLPLPWPFATHPLSVRLVIAAAAAHVVLGCHREGAELNPLVPRSQALDRMSSPFVLVAVLELMIVVQLLLVGFLIRD